MEFSLRLWNKSIMLITSSTVMKIKVIVSSLLSQNDDIWISAGTGKGKTSSFYFGPLGWGGKVEAWPSVPPKWRPWPWLRRYTSCLVLHSFQQTSVFCQSPLFPLSYFTKTATVWNSSSSFAVQHSYDVLEESTKKTSLYHITFSLPMGYSVVPNGMVPIGMAVSH